MATPTSVLAFCFLKWVYEQAAKLLEKLKQMLLALIAYIDVLVIQLKAWLAQYDFLAKWEELTYKAITALVDKIKNELLSFADGPNAAYCPEFYHYLFDPAISLLDASLATFSSARSKYKNMLSYMDELNRVIQYWETTKLELIHLVDVIDDAIRHALLREAADLVP